MRRSSLHSSTAIVLILALLSTSCITTRKGAYVGDRNLDRQTVQKASYTVTPVQTFAADGRVTLEIQQDQQYRVAYTKKYRELRNREGEPWGILFLGGAASFIVGAAMAPACFWPSEEGEPKEPCDTPAEEASVDDALPWIIGGGVAGTLGLFGGLWALADDGGKPTGRVITDGRFVREETAPGAALSNEPISIRLNERTHRYTTDASGRITLDPARDFGLQSMERPRPLVASIVFPDQEATHEVTLDPEAWMQPQFRITEARYRLRTRPSTRSTVVGQTTSDDLATEHKILDETDAWVQIERHDRTVWLHSGAGERFWAAPTYVNPNRLPSLAATIDFQEPSGKIGRASCRERVFPVV